MRRLLFVLVSLSLTFNVQAATSVDFESATDATCSCDEFAADGFTFSTVAAGTTNLVGCPCYVRQGPPRDAFGGCSGDISCGATANDDGMVAGQGVGCMFLSDDLDNIGMDGGDVLVTFSAPVMTVSGDLIDVDLHGATFTEFTVTARSCGGTTLDTDVVTAPAGLADASCVSSAGGPGDGAALPFSLSSASTDICSVLVAYTGTFPRNQVGWALDNIVVDVDLLPTVALRACDILVADRFVPGVFQVDPFSGAQTLISSGGSLGLLEDVVVEPSGQLLVSRDSPSSAIIRIDPANGGQTTLSSLGSNVFPKGLVIDGAGDLLVAVGGLVPAIIRIDRVTGTQAVVSSGGSFVEPTDIEIESSGDLIVTDTFAFEVTALDRGAVFRVDPSTGVQSVITAGMFSSLAGAAIDASGDIFVLDQFGSKVFRIDPISGARTLVASGGAFDGYLDVEIDANGDLVVSNRSPGFSSPLAVLRVDPISGGVTVISQDGSFGGPFGLTIVAGSGSDSDGDCIPDTSDICPTAFNPLQETSVQSGLEGRGCACLCGDVNNSCSVNGLDSQDILLKILPFQPFPPCVPGNTGLCGVPPIIEVRGCDVNGSSSCSGIDAQIIFQVQPFLIGTPVFPIIVGGGPFDPTSCAQTDPNPIQPF